MRRLSLRTDPDMEWIYKPEFQNDPRAIDLRARREAALQSAPRWMIDEARTNDQERDRDKGGGK